MNIFNKFKVKPDVRPEMESIIIGDLYRSTAIKPSFGLLINATHIIRIAGSDGAGGYNAELIYTNDNRYNIGSFYNYAQSVYYIGPSEEYPEYLV